MTPNLQQCRIAFVLVAASSATIIGLDLWSGTINPVTVINGFLLGASIITILSISIFIRQSDLIGRLLVINRSLMNQEFMRDNLYLHGWPTNDNSGDTVH